MFHRVIPVILSTLLLAGAAVAADDLIIESGKEGQNPDKYQELTGSWMDSRVPANHTKSAAAGCTEQGKCTTRKTIFAKTTTDTVHSASARFLPGFTAPGHYFVYVTWPRGASARDVTYKIKSAKGDDAVVLSQDGYGVLGGTNSSQWHLLGEYDFSAGADQYVDLVIGANTKPLPGQPGQAYADAMRFTQTKLGGEQAKASKAPVVASSVTKAANPGTLVWASDLRSAQATAKAEKKCVLLFVASSSGDISRSYEEMILNDAKTRTLLASRFLLVRMDYERDFDAANELGIYKGGQVRVYSPDGVQVSQLREKLSPDEFCKQLQTGIK